MSTLLPSFIVFLELKQAKFFWSVLLIFGKTEAFLFHFYILPFINNYIINTLFINTFINYFYFIN